MSTVLFLNGPASGHINPTLGIVEELIATGEQVIYLCSEEFRKRIEGTGAVFFPYQNFLLGDNPFQTNKHYLSLVIKILSSYDVILPCIYELSKRYSFDYVIHDSMYGCGHIAAEQLNIPNISTCTSFIRAERFLSNTTDKKTMFKENLQLVRQFSTISKRIWSTYGLKRKIDINDIFFNEGLLNLVFTSEYFQPQSEELGPQYQFIGPILSNRYDNIPLRLERNPNQKLIYISMGTVFNNVRSFYQLCFEALGSMDMRVVLSTGSQIELDHFAKIPSNFTVLPYAPQLQILQEADLFVSHGGMNSVNEALFYGVPLLIIPLAADQPIVANRTVELGAGKSLEYHGLTAKLFRETVYELLGNELFMKNSSKIGDNFRTAGGRKKAIEHIKAFKNKFGIMN